MTPTADITSLAIVLGQMLLLFWLSHSFLLGYAMRTLASAQSSARARRLVALLRLPGNLLHEISHAAAYIATGYRIRRFATCWSDPEGRGYVETGPPWFPLHFAPLSAAASCAAPLIMGALAIYGLGRLLGVPLPATDVTSTGVWAAARHLVSNVGRLAAQLDWTAWQTYVFAVLAFSIGAELAPSGHDIRRGLVMLCVMIALFVFGLLAIPHMELRPESARILFAGAHWLLSTLSTALFAGLMGCSLVALPVGVLAWLVRRSQVVTPKLDRPRPPFQRSRRRSGRSDRALGRR